MENHTPSDVSLKSETESDQHTQDDVLTDLKHNNQETPSDIREVSSKSESASNPNTSTPTSKYILPSFSTFINGSVESQARTSSERGSKTSPQISTRRCASKESDPTKTIQLHRLHQNHT